MAIDLVGERNSTGHHFVLVLAIWEIRAPLRAICKQGCVRSPTSPNPDKARDGLLETGVVSHFDIEFRHIDLLDCDDSARI